MTRWSLSSSLVGFELLFEIVLVELWDVDWRFHLMCVACLLCTEPTCVAYPYVGVVGMTFRLWGPLKDYLIF